MNAGLGNLFSLKTILLPPDESGDTRFDTALTALGLGVAGQIEKFCNRKFCRVVGDTYTFPGDRSLYLLPRYPVEVLTSVQRRDNFNADWAPISLTDYLVELDETSGLVTMYGYGGNGCPPAVTNPSTPGLQLFAGAGENNWARKVRLLFAWTGGYFFNTLEPTDEGYPQALPEGAYALPNDLSFAWLKQCEFIWQRQSKLGVSLAGGLERTRWDTLGSEPISPIVTNLLAPFVRQILD